MHTSKAHRGIGVVILLGLSAMPTMAQGLTSSGQLTLNLTVQSSISLVFKNNPSVGSPGFCPLTNANTNNVGLNLGTASFPGGATSACVNYSHFGAATYQVSSAFDVVVTKANTSSPNYRLAAEISTVPPANVAWLVNNTVLNSSVFSTLDVADNYGQAVTKTLQVQVKNTVPAQTLQETITFLATAN